VSTREQFLQPAATQKQHKKYVFKNDDQQKHEGEEKKNEKYGEKQTKKNKIIY
jgi:hypothetical protein